VLLVQPERDDREMYAEFLHHEGLASMCVSTATQGIRLAPYSDVVVTGLLLPGPVDGFELITRLKRGERTCHIPIVVLTACAWTTERERAEAAGCDVFLSKPCLPHELLREVRRLLAESFKRVSDMPGALDELAKRRRRIHPLR
jgi:two-component system, cell cycle response regulator DivK